MNENVDFIARCIAGSAQETARKAISDLGGMQILKLTKEEFDSIEHDSDTIYFVTIGDKIEQYVGDTKLLSGSIEKSNTINTIINGKVERGFYSDQ